MSSGRPDWHSIITISGKYDNTFVPVKLDSTGQLYIIMTGQSLNVDNFPSDYFKADQDVGIKAGQSLDVDNHPSDYFKANEAVGAVASIAANVTVDQSDSDRVVKGTEGANKRPILVDADGVLIARMKAAYGASLLDVSIDSAGIMLSRIKGAASGDLILLILEDCGDTTTVTDWVESSDGLNPVENSVFVKQGTKSIAFGVDADKSGDDHAEWVNSHDWGDMSNYQHDWVYLWVYIPTLDYIESAVSALRFWIGTDASNRLRFYFAKSSLVVGWNLLKCDLDNPTGVAGTVDWANIEHLRFRVQEIASNTDDFTLYVDSIMFVRPTPGTGTLKDLAVDENGVLLSKITGEYAGILKSLAIDKNGHMLANMKGDFSGALKTIAVDTNGVMKANLTTQDLDFLTVRPAYGEAVRLTLSAKNVPANTEETLFTASGRGVTLGGFIEWIDADPTPAEIYFRMYIDGAMISAMTVEDMSKRRLDIEGVGPIIIRNYNLDTDDKYVIAFCKGFTFEETCIIKCYNTDVALALTLAHCDFVYALVP